jgi:hypothetical protein
VNGTLSTVAAPIVAIASTRLNGFAAALAISAPA